MVETLSFLHLDQVVCIIHELLENMKIILLKSLWPTHICCNHKNRYILRCPTEADTINNLTFTRTLNN